jgi:hypothetical protein
MAQPAEFHHQSLPLRWWVVQETLGYLVNPLPAVPSQVNAGFTFVTIYRQKWLLQPSYDNF